MDSLTLQYYATNAESVANRYESIVNGLATHFETAFPVGTRVLDLGCGSGRDMALLQRQGRDAYGLDASAELVEIAQRVHPELAGRVIYGVLPGCTVPFGGAFDGVLCSAVLMHISLKDLASTIAFIHCCLCPGGKLLYSVPSRRDDIQGDDHRDAAGRLFLPDSGGRLKAMFEQQGFECLQQWINEDSLGRDEVAWQSVLMRRH